MKSGKHKSRGPREALHEEGRQTKLNYKQEVSLGVPRVRWPQLIGQS